MSVKKGSVLVLVLLGMVSIGAGASIQVEGLSAENINATWTGDGVNFNTSYLDKTVSYNETFKPDDLATKNGVQVKTTTKKNDSLQVEVSYEVSSTEQDYQWLQDAKFSGKIDIKKGEKKSSFLNGSINSDKDETIYIDSDSHYEHLILDYNLTDAGVEQNTTEDVYSGSDTQRIPVTGRVNQVGAGTVEQTVTKDNKYEPESEETLVLAHEPETNITGIEWGNLPHYEVDVDYGSDVEPELTDADMTVGQLENPGDYEFTAYNVTYPADSKKSVEVTYEQPVYSPIEDDNPENFEFDYYGYVLGSVATFSVDSSSEWLNGNFDGTAENSSALIIPMNDSDHSNIGGNSYDTSDKTGLKIKATSHLPGFGMVIDKEATSGVTKAYLTDSSLNVLKSKSASAGDTVDFYYDIEKDNYYYLLVDAGGSTYTRGYRLESFPSTNKHFDIVTGYQGGDSDNRYSLDTVKIVDVNSGNYSSKVYSASEDKVWKNITVGGLDRPGSSTVELWVNTSAGETDKISNATLVDGTNTYTLDLPSGATDVQYNVSMTAGSTPSIDSVSIDGETANAAPQFDQNEVLWESIGGTESKLVNFSISDPDGDQISDYTATLDGMVEDKFSNSTLKFSGWSSPHDSIFQISDFSGATSSVQEVNFTVTEDSGYREDDYAHTLDDQQTNYTVEIQNRGDSADYTLSFADDGSVVTDGSLTDNTLSSGVTSSTTEVWSGDWITNEEEKTYSKSETSFLHSEDTQELENQTLLEVDNSRSWTWSGVDLTSTCSNTASADVASGTDVQVTTNCNKPAFKGDYITESVGSPYSDPSKESNFSTQALAKDKNLTNTVSVSWTGVNVSAPSVPGCSNCDVRDVDVGAGSTVTETYNGTGDWMEQESNSSIFYDTGTVRYGVGIDTNFTARQNVTAKNNRTDGLALTVNASNYLGRGNQCTFENGTEFTWGADTKSTKQMFQDCDPGYEINNTDKKTDSNDFYVYEERSWIHVNSNITEEEEHRFCQKQSRLENWENRDPTETSATVDGSSTDVSVGERTIDGTEYVCIDVGDQHGASSLHEGDHETVLEYKESKIQGGGGGGGSTSTSETIIEEVEGEFEWTISALGTDKTEFQFFGFPGREDTVPLKVENTGDRAVNLTLKCVSTDGSCSFVDINGVDEYQVNLDTSSFTETTVNVHYRVPQNSSKEQYSWVVQASDPSGSSAEVDFQVDMNNPLGQVFSRYSRVLSFVEVSPPGALPVSDSADSIPVPFFLLPLIPSILVFGGLRTVSSKGGGVLVAQVLGTIVIFIVLIGLIP